MSVIARYFANGELHVNKIVTEESAYEDNNEVDDDYALDDDQEFDSAEHISSFISYLYNLETYGLSVDSIGIDSNGYLSLPSYSFTERGFSLDELLNSDYILNDSATLNTNMDSVEFMSFLIGITNIDTPVKTMRVLSNGELRVASIIEVGGLIE